MSEFADEARVAAAYGRELDLRFDDGRECRGRVKGRRLQPVCGDRVLAAPLANEPQWLVSAILQRRNALTRPDRGGRVEVLAANVDFVAVVAAPLPAADWFIVDRYLCAAELIGAESVVLYNKIDLGEVPAHDAGILTEYAAAGYPVLRSSASRPASLAPLAAHVAGRTAIVVGQSGVGKSSLINALTGEDALPTAPVSGKRREGKHTTVASRMRPLPGGGDVIDSPGVRDYAPAIETPADTARGFREIHEAAAKCRFADCAHLREPDCAVAAAVADGGIAPRRYESYRRLLRLSRKIDERAVTGRQPGGQRKGRPPSR